MYEGDVDGEVVLRSASTDEEERKNKESEGSEYKVLEYRIFKRKRSAEDDLFVRPSESVGSSTKVTTSDTQVQVLDYQ